MGNTEVIAMQDLTTHYVTMPPPPCAALIPVNGKHSRRSLRAALWTVPDCRNTLGPWTELWTVPRPQPEEQQLQPINYYCIGPPAPLLLKNQGSFSWERNGRGSEEEEGRKRTEEGRGRSKW